MGDAFYALDGEWRIIYANRRALEFWGTTADRGHRPRHLATLPAPWSARLNEQVLRRVREEQRPSPSRRPRRRRASGSRSTSVRPATASRSTGATSANASTPNAHSAASPRQLEREVADRTHALSDVVDELRRSRARYSAIFEHSPVDLVFMAVQPDGRIVCEDANPAWERHSGYARDFVVGKSLEEILPREQAEFATMQYRRAIETRQPVEYEYTARFPIGEVSRRSFLVPLPGDERAHRACAADLGRSDRRCGAWKRNCARRRRWRRSANSPAASRTTSTICSPR